MFRFIGYAIVVEGNAHNALFRTRAQATAFCRQHNIPEVATTQIFYNDTTMVVAPAAAAEENIAPAAAAEENNE